MTAAPEPGTQDLPRLRIHSDGRWAILADPGDVEPWLTHPLQTPGGPITEAVDWLSDAQVHERGWSEAAVVELPEPDDVAGDIATFGGHCISAGADPNAVEAWRRYAGRVAAIAAWGERPGGDPR